MYHSRLQSVRVAGAPVLLDRAQVIAYSARVSNGIRALAQAVDARVEAKRAMPKSAPDSVPGVLGDSTHNIAYSTADGRLPFAWWVGWMRFKEDALDFDDSIQQFNLLGPTVWSAWGTAEGNESQYLQYKRDFEQKYDGLTQDSNQVSQDTVAAEHPTNNSWFPSFGSALSLLPWTLLVGAGAFYYVSTTLPSRSSHAEAKK